MTVCSLVLTSLGLSSCDSSAVLFLFEGTWQLPVFQLTYARVRVCPKYSAIWNTTRWHEPKRDEARFQRYSEFVLVFHLCIFDLMRDNSAKTFVPERALHMALTLASRNYTNEFSPLAKRVQKISDEDLNEVLGPKPTKVCGYHVLGAWHIVRTLRRCTDFVQIWEYISKRKSSSSCAQTSTGRGRPCSLILLEICWLAKEETGADSAKSPLNFLGEALELGDVLTENATL